MKKIRKVLPILMAVLLIAVCSVGALADASNYAAFQIFEGTMATGSTNLAVSGWGDGVDGAALLAELKSSDAFGASNPFAACSSAADVATAMATWTDNSAEAKAFAMIAYRNKTAVSAEIGDTMDVGYYLVVDTSSTAGGLNTVSNLALLQLTQKSTFDTTIKVGKPVIVKKVKDIDNSSETDLTDWQDSADHDMGDDVPLLLRATLGENLDAFPTYKIVYHDTESAGLTFDSESVKLYLDDSTTPISTDLYSVVTTNLPEGETFQVVVPNVKLIEGVKDGSVLSVEYTAELNTSANLGSAGNPSKVFLEYSNNPNWSEDGPEGEAGGPGGLEATSTGHTPEDKVIVFTYKVAAHKEDENGDDLTGADFTLYKFILDENGSDTYKTTTGTWTVVTKDANTTDPDFAWIGIDDGIYKLVESTVPAGYTGMLDQYFTVSATHDVLNDNPALNTLSGEKESGSVIAFTNDSTTGVISTDVVNRAGSTLPETGGNGTMIFFILGGVLLCGGVIVMITKKRMSCYY